MEKKMYNFLVSVIKDFCQMVLQMFSALCFDFRDILMIKFSMICPYDILFIIGFWFAVMEEICLVKTRSVCSSHCYHCLTLLLSKERK